MYALIFFALLASIVWFWTDSLRARERAYLTCAGACRDLDVQLLDQTVALVRLSLSRDSKRRVRIQRWYGFEFSVDGCDRYNGIAALLGPSIEYVQLEHPHGRVILNTALNPLAKNYQ